jgi:DNA topoisomerase II
MSKKYQKLDHREHILKRPNMYIGSVEKDNYKTWVFSSDEQKMVKKEITYVPGLYKIFDEILVNAIDHSVRMKMKKEKGEDVNLVKNIKISIDKSTGYIEVLNDGDGIDVEIHEEQKIYVPELIFGHLLTSSNYDDKEEKIIGGQNGLGAKTTNIFSKSFYIETIDHKRKKIYKQEFTNNMSEKSKPEIKSCAKKPYTLVRFLPDYEKFGISGLSDDIYDMMVKRVYDTCAVTDTDVSIYLNSEKLDYKNFEKYVNMYLGEDKQETMRIYEKIDDRWEIVVAMSKTGSFEHVSFVNGIWTIRGGKHIEYMTNQLTKKLVDMASKKKKDMTIKPQYIKDNLFVFIKSTIVNPAFDSQTKETLTTPYSKFGSKPEMTDKFVEKVYKSGIIEEALRIGDAMDNKSLKKTDGKKRNIIRGLTKLDDANWAGTNKSHECTLILDRGGICQNHGIGRIESSRT